MRHAINPHIKIASLSLPPSVQGEARGELVVLVERLAWNRKPLQQVQIRLRWWGAAADTVVPYHPARGAGAAFPLTSGPRYLSRYLKDMGSLAVAVEECPSGRPVGQVTIDISSLDVCRPVEGSIPLKGSNGQLLATADVSLRVHYSALLSSFELNEHLATTDKQLPLYPVPAVRHQDQQQLQARAATAGTAASPSAANKENMVAGGQPSSTSKPAARLSHAASADQQSPPASNPADSKPVEADGQTAKKAAAAHDSTAGKVQQPQQQQQQQDSGNPGLQVASAPAAAQATDPLGDIVRKAEQLKQAMDQAAQRGITLALPQVGLMGGLASLGASLPGRQAAAAAYPSLLGSPLWSAVQQPLLPLQQPQLLTGLQPPLLGLGGSSSSAAAGARLAGRAGANRRSATLALPWSAAAAAYVGAAAGVCDAGRLANQQQQEQLSPAAAAVLQLPYLSQGAGIGYHDDGGSSGSYSGSEISELEDLEEIEDLLLQELFSSTRGAAAGRSASSTSTASPQQREGLEAAADRATAAASSEQAHGQPQEAAATEAAGQVVQQPHKEQQQQPAAAPSSSSKDSVAGPLLQVELYGIQGITPVGVELPSALTAVVKSAGHTYCSLDVTALLQQQGQQTSTSGGCSCPCSAVIAGPSCLSGPLLATDKPCMAVELWSGSHRSSSSQAAAKPLVAGELLGIVRVPLQQCTAMPSGSSMQVDQPRFASGTYPVYDVLRGTHSGSLELRVLLAEVQPTADVGDGATAASADLPAGVGPSAVLAVRHVIDVTVHTANHLPDAQQLQDGRQQVPESRFMRYSFPGEEELYTQEVGVVAAPVFSAHAQHTVVLPPGQSVAECLLCVDDAGEEEALRFEVFNKWQDDTDSLVASGSLPLQQVLQLSQVDHPATSEATACMRTFLVPLHLVPGCGEAAVQQQGSAVLLQVTVSYTAVNCYSMEELEGAAALDVELEVQEALPEAAAAAKAAVVPSEMGAEVCSEEELGQDLLATPAPRQSVTADSNAPAGAVFAAATAATAGADGAAMADGGAVEHEPEDSSGVSADTGDKDAPREQQHDAAASVATLSAAAEMSAAAAAAPLQASSAETVSAQTAAAADPVVAAGGQAAPQCLSAELCVEVIRACGLQAAVKDAEQCLGGSSGLLGRAQQLGPHPYATLNLPISSSKGGSKALQVLKTPFQAQTFCPQFHHRQVVPVTLDGPTLSAIASGNCSVELWHHCPRSQAVAAALSRGQSSSYVMGGQQQVFLGSGSCPLQALLTTAQGIRSWLVLKSQLGQPVGAVQVSVAFTHIGGAAHDTCPAAACPLSRCPRLLQLLPESPAAAMRPLLAAPPDGFRGQLARLSVHIEELLLPGGDEVLLERPKIAKYTASYRLPGSHSAECHTHSKASSSQQPASLLARGWHVDWQFCNTHWATADWRLGRALQAYPLLLAVSKQEPSRRSSAGARSAGSTASSTAGDTVLLPVGAVEVDLSSLLLSRPGSARPSCRWLSGVYAVVHPMCKNLGNTRIKLKVLLDLQPAEPPPQHLLGDHAVFWEVAGPLALQEIPAAVEVLAQQAGNGAQHQPHAPAERQPQQPLGSDRAASVAVAVATSSPVQPGTAEHASSLSSSCPTGSPAGDTAMQVAALQQQPSSVSECMSPVEVDEAHVIAAAAAVASTAVDDLEVCRPIANKRSRLRAEVSHVPAPLTAGSNSPSAAGVQQQQQQHQEQPVLAEQERQPLAVTADLFQAPNPQQQQLLQQAVQPLQQPQLHENQLLRHTRSLQDVRVCVEEALNLDLPPADEGCEQCLYVSYAWPPAGEGVVINTPLVPANCGPRGQTASAKWLHAVHVPLAVQQGQRQETDGIIATGAGSTAGSDKTEQAPMLTLLVWLRAVPHDAAAELPPLYAGIAAMPCPDDRLLGCAMLDLSALHVLGSIEGWYNVTDEEQQLRGQLKVSLMPLKQLASPLRSAIQPGSTQLLTQQAAAGQVHRIPKAVPPAALPGCGPLVRSSSASAAPLALADTGAGADEVAAAAIDRWGTEELAAAGFADAGLAGAADGASAADDGLLATLRANLQELDEISAALLKRVAMISATDRLQQEQGSAALPDSATPAADPSTGLRPPAAMPLTPASAGTPASGQPGSAAQQHSAAGYSAAERAHSFRQVQTLSDDEEYMVAVGGVSNSDTDTEELMGRVDWSLAQNSDDEGPPGPPRLMAGSSAAAAAALPAAPLGPLNTDDWMFDISKPAAPAASSSCAGPVNPAQLSHSAAASERTAAAERLAAAEASRAAAAAARTAAEERNRQRQEASDAAAAAAGHQLDVWQQLADLEEAEDQQARQQRQQRVQQQQQTGADLNDPRQLPEELNARLDQLLANFQGASGGPAPGSSSRAAAAAGGGPAGPHVAGSSAAADGAARTPVLNDWDDDDLGLDGDCLPPQRVAHNAAAGEQTGRVAFANSLPPVQDDFSLEFSDRPLQAVGGQTAPPAAAGAGENTRGCQSGFGGRAAAIAAQTYDDGLDDDAFLPAQRVVLEVSSSSSSRVAFANDLPPMQEDFVLEYSDVSQRHSGSVHRTPAPTGTVAEQVAAAAVVVQEGATQQHVAGGSTSTWQHPAAAGVPVTSTAAVNRPGSGADSSSSTGNRVGGSSNRALSNFVPVIGDCSAAVLDDMFSFTRAAGNGRTARPHPALTVNAAVGPAAAGQPSLQVPAAAGASRASSNTSSTFVPVLGQYSAAALDSMFSFRRDGGSNRSASSSIRHPGM